ncbi:MAG: DUF2628 domain-containing protein [Pseudomonadota bacterium]
MIYTIHAPAGVDPKAIAARAENAPGAEGALAGLDGLRAIPEMPARWSILAPPVWLVWHGLYVWLAVYVVFVLAVGALLASSFYAAALVLGSLPPFLLLLEGHQLRRRQLDRKGYTFVGVADGQSETHAITSYLARLNEEVVEETPVVTPPVVRRPTRTPEPAFGMFADGNS